MTDATTIAANLARLRLDRSLTQEGLALKSGLSRLALGRIERGDAIRRASTVRVLAKALNVPVGELIVPVRPLESVRFRAKAKVRSREQVLAVVSKWLEAYAWLEEELGERADFGFGKARRWSEAKPTAMAQAARKAVGLAPEAPVRDICGLLNQGGVKLLLLETNRDSFFGLSVGQADGGPAVVVNTWERISVERWIFTAAHELGHLLLHPDEYQRQATDLPEDAEREADEFASAFLMPECAFSPAWDATSGHSLLSRILKVKRIFRVSYKTVLYRLVQSGREQAPRVWQAFQAQHKAYFGKTLRKADEPRPLTKSEFAWSWGRAGEPDGLSRHDFMEDRLHRLVRQAFEGGRISMGRAAEILGLEREDMRRLAGEWAT